MEIPIKPSSLAQAKAGYKEELQLALRNPVYDGFAPEIENGDTA
jgi:hypothetical protein